MKTIAVFFTGLALLAGLGSCENETIEPVVAPVVSDEEAAGLQFMREEEKLARDVYLSLYEVYPLQVFSNIAASEQRHMDEVLQLLDQFGLPDPASDSIGVFANPDLQQLYDYLLVQGLASEEAALLAGATIEDVDIRDLDQFISASANSDIIRVYQFLKCGSRNHLRAFSNRLSERGITYSPQYITPEAYEAILAGEQEKCGLSY